MNFHNRSAIFTNLKNIKINCDHKTIRIVKVVLIKDIACFRFVKSFNKNRKIKESVGFIVLNLF